MADVQNGETACDVPHERLPTEETDSQGKEGDGAAGELPAHPKESPQSGVLPCIRFVHHLGVLLFSPVLMKLDELGGEYKALIKEHHNPHKDKQRTATLLSLNQQETDLTQPELPDGSSRKLIFEVGST